MRPRPDVDEYERPKVNNAQAVAVNRALRRFRQKVIHDAEDRRREEERDGVMPVPPLHKRILNAAEDRIAVCPTCRDREMIDDVEHRHGDDRRDVKPDRHVEARLVAASERPEEVDREDHPDERDGDINRPDQFGVFLPACQPEWERDCSRDNDELPAPEVNLREEF